MLTEQSAVTPLKVYMLTFASLFRIHECLFLDLCLVVVCHHRYEPQCLLPSEQPNLNLQAFVLRPQCLTEKIEKSGVLFLNSHSIHVRKILDNGTVSAGHSASKY